MDVKFLKQYQLNPDGITQMEIPPEANHYKIRKGKMNVYDIDGEDNGGYHKIPDGCRAVRVISRRHMYNINRSVEWY
jgi:hypothetical protein